MIFKIMSTIKNMHLDKKLDPLDLFLNEDDQRIDFLIVTIPEEKKLHYHNAGDCFYLFSVVESRYIHAGIIFVKKMCIYG